MGSRRKARECALQMLFAADVAEMPADDVVRSYWAELGESDLDDTAREFATRLASRTLSNLELLDERIRSRAEHWRISRMAVVDRNILRLAVYEFLYEPTPRTVAINEALEIARRFSTYEATQFINGILDAIKRDLDEQQPQKNVQPRKTRRDSRMNTDRRYFTAVEQLRAVAGDGPATRKVVDALFRHVHNLKANASANGLNDLAAAAHEFENVLHSIRTGARRQPS